MKKFIEVTNKQTGRSRLIAVDYILSVIEDSDGSAFIEFYSKYGVKVYGMECKEGYAKVRCMLIDIFGG